MKETNTPDGRHRMLVLPCARRQNDTAGFRDWADPMERGQAPAFVGSGARRTPWRTKTHFRVISVGDPRAAPRCTSDRRAFLRAPSVRGPDRTGRDTEGRAVR